ncbi:MAG: cytochrome C oxidase subunit II [Deltaproteobacteria bacterium]|nr:cytochrome C oxidase subunit II [Deltaproteobacteria bacterium]
MMKVAYLAYTLIAVSFLGYFGRRVTLAGTTRPGATRAFYAWVGCLVLVGVGIHVFTFNKIPWVKWDLTRDTQQIDQEFEIRMAEHEFRLPSRRIEIETGNMVRFNVTSSDLTYGFGLFREDGSMMFQMQVLPGYDNDLVWLFDKPGIYSIRSTEYSGPDGKDLFLEDVVIVSDLLSDSLAAVDL